MADPTLDPPQAEAPPAPDADGGDAALVEEELLIEEISIDGMCGVY
jgi:mycofactocin precursor